MVADLAVPQIDQAQLASEIEERRVQARHEHETVSHGREIGNLKIRFLPIGCAGGVQFLIDVVLLCLCTPCLICATRLGSLRICQGGLGQEGKEEESQGGSTRGS